LGIRRALLVILTVAVFIPTGVALGAPLSVAQTQAPLLIVQAAEEADTQQADEGQATEEEKDVSEEVDSSLPPPTPAGAKEGAPARPPTGIPAVPGPLRPGGPQYVSLNFDNADLELVLRSIADITGINFIIGPGVKANVTMRTTTRVPSTDVFSILESVLEVNNLAAVKDGSYYKIVPVAVAQQEPQDVQIGKDRVDERERYVTQIVQLEHLSADETSKILQSLMGKGAKMIVHKETNSLIVAGFTSTIKRVLDTIKALDVPSKRDNIQRIFVYFVENAKAVELANTLNILYGRRDMVRGAAPGTRTGQPGARPTPGAPIPPAPVSGQPTPPAPLPGLSTLPAALPTGAEATPSEVVGDVTIVSDEATNTLIIKTSPRNYEFIEATIKKLDIVPKQVLIELLIAEITLSDKFNFSLEEILKTGSFFLAGAYSDASIKALGALTKATAPVVGQGFTMTFVEADKFRVVLNNLAAVTKVDILASPHLLTANNKEAKIQIGNEVPIVTGDQSSLTNVTAPPGSGTAGGVFRTIQQKDIGIIVGIKPHVNEKRLVALDIESEHTSVDPSGTTVSGTPSFLKRTTKTAVVVQDGQSLVIGGIIQQSKSKGYAGIPFLSQIPLLGYLFRSTAETLDRTELIFLITPHVIASPEEGQQLTEQFKGRVESLEPILKSMPQLRKLKP